MNTIRFRVLSESLGKLLLCILLFSSFLVLTFIPGVVLEFSFRWFNDFQLAIIYNSLNILLIIFLYQRYTRQLKQKNPFQYGNKRINKKIINLLLLIGIAIFFIEFIYTDILNLERPENQKIVEALLAILPITMTIAIIFIAPILEELLFRGIFFNYFLSKNNPTAKYIALLANALIFGVLHEPWLSSISSFIVYSLSGLLLAITYLHTRDLRYSILIHMINNTISVLLTIYS